MMVFPACLQKADSSENQTESRQDGTGRALAEEI